MYAIVRQNCYTSEDDSALQHALSVVKEAHLNQPGYAGSITIRNGDRLLAINLWESEADAFAGRSAIGLTVQDLLAPFMVGLSEFLGAGEVVVVDVTKGVIEVTEPDPRVSNAAITSKTCSGAISH